MLTSGGEGILGSDLTIVCCLGFGLVPCMLTLPASKISAIAYWAGSKVLLRSTSTSVEPCAPGGAGGGVGSGDCAGTGDGEGTGAGRRVSEGEGEGADEDVAMEGEGLVSLVAVATGLGPHPELSRSAANAMKARRCISLGLVLSNVDPPFCYEFALGQDRMPPSRWAYRVGHVQAFVRCACPLFIEIAGRTPSHGLVGGRRHRHRGPSGAPLGAAGPRRDHARRRQQLARPAEPVADQHRRAHP